MMKEEEKESSSNNTPRTPTTTRIVQELVSNNTTTTPIVRKGKRSTSASAIPSYTSSTGGGGERTAGSPGGKSTGSRSPRSGKSGKSARSGSVGSIIESTAIMMDNHSSSIRSDSHNSDNGTGTGTGGTGTGGQNGGDGGSNGGSDNGNGKVLLRGQSSKQRVEKQLSMGSFGSTNGGSTTTTKNSTSRHKLLKKQNSMQSLGSTTSGGTASKMIMSTNIANLIQSITTASNNSNGSSSNGDNSNSFEQRAKIAAKRTLLLRGILIISLLVAVSVCASLSYVKLRDTEVMVGRQTYESIAASALIGAQSITKRKVQGSEVMATLLSHTLPDKEDWPYITMEGYIPIAQKVAELSSSGTQALMVIHTPEQLESFENHTSQVYKEQNRPETAGYSEFGFGVWKPDKGNSPYSDGRSHDITGIPSWANAKRTLFTTLMMHNQPGANSLLYNVYSEADRGIHIDSMLDCIEENGGTINNYNYAKNGVVEVEVDDGTIITSTTSSPSCGVITNMLELKVKPGPAGLLFQPIYPSHDPKTFVGFATTSIHWEEVLTNIVPDYVSGLTCVVQTATRSYTYEIQKGQPILLGDGDLHDTTYSKYARSTILNEIIVTGTKASAIYTLTVYPTNEMFHAFSTNSPKAVAFGFFGAIAGCTIIFFIYDFLMRREHTHRKEILEIKRRFVRFISHEIRTPLNTCCMGLELLESELQPYRIKPTPSTPAAAAAAAATTTTVPTLAGNSSFHSTGSGGKRIDDTGTIVAMPPPATPQETSSGGGVDYDKVEAEDIDFWHNVIVDINENAYVAVSILNDLLNYDKLESGELKLEHSIVNLWDLVERTVNQFRIQAVNKKVDLKLTILHPGQQELQAEQEQDTMEGGGTIGDTDHHYYDLWNVWGDDVRLSQVIRNVLSNGLKFTPPEGVIDVTIRHVPDGLSDAKHITVCESSPLSEEEDNDPCTTTKDGVEGAPPTSSSTVVVADATVLRERAGSVVVSIKDSGVGLTKDQLKQLFSEGVQFDANKLQHGGGSGLGLSIAKGIIEQHSGTIRAESEGQGRGTTFILEIPLHEFTPEEINVGHEDQDGDTYPTSSSTPNGSSLKLGEEGAAGEANDTTTGTTTKTPVQEQHHRVLVAEDAASSRKMLTRLLERGGHKCVPAGNGQEAVLAVQRDLELSMRDPSHVPIDTILMDYEMPVLNGPDACRAIRSIGYKGFILGVTGNVLVEDVEFFREHGADDVLAKPIRFERIKNYWDRHKSGMKKSGSGAHLNTMGLVESI